MNWPELSAEPVSRLRLRTRVVVVLVDDVTGLPPQMPPLMRLQRLVARQAVELESRGCLTAGGAVVFRDFGGVVAGNAVEHYRVIVEGDGVQRPERPGGYPFTVGTDLAKWPVRLVVRLLPGPGYAYPRSMPVIHGRVVELAPDRPVVADAVVASSEPAAQVVPSRCVTDERGSFSLGLPRYRSSRSIFIRASAPGYVAGAFRAVRPKDLERPINLTVRR